MNKFTPGPWHYSGEIRPCGYEVKHPLYCGEVRADESDRYLGSVCEIQSAAHVDGISNEQAEANARLIAAAPELLEALELARSELAGLPHSLGYEFTHISQIDAVIAKARGES